MKLSEALVLRADPRELLAELDRLFEQLTDLIPRINRTNLSATLEGGLTLTDALARRDILTLRGGVLKSTADAAANTVGRYSRTEIRQVATIDVGALRRQIDRLAQERRELDTAIQAANWTTELLD